VVESRTDNARMTTRIGSLLVVNRIVNWIMNFNGPVRKNFLWVMVMPDTGNVQTDAA